MPSYRISVTFTEEEYLQMKKISMRSHQSQSETIRNLVGEALRLHVTEDNLDFITTIMSDQIKASLAPYMERLIKLNAKTCIQSGTSVYLNAEALSQFVPISQQQDFLEAYERARKKAIADLKSKD